MLISDRRQIFDLSAIAGLSAVMGRGAATFALGGFLGPLNRLLIGHSNLTEALS